MASAAPRVRVEAFMWTDSEVELLLRVTLDYKTTKLQENVDWESCHSKYSDIMEAFQAQYPQSPVEQDFPHDAKSVTKPQVSSKLKSIRTKYRRAVETGRRRGLGRVLLLYSKLCEEIWGGSRAASAIDAGIETADMEEEPSTRTSPAKELPGDSIQSSSAPGSLPSAAIKQRRDSLQARLNNHRGGRLKRRLTGDQAALEDLQIKRKMLELMEQSSKRNADVMQKINTNIANITNSIQENFSLVREGMLQPAYPHSSSGFGQHQHTLMRMAPHPATAAVREVGDRETHSIKTEREVGDRETRSIKTEREVGDRETRNLFPFILIINCVIDTAESQTHDSDRQTAQGLKKTN
ncbi:uncharacterized protein LOC132865807 [Neoarius graeffei]|uniref:uncharacterized protein LOC132865807 n=1 Tax=Neoarius graeffei TaxID=443677 RepID=UPI00298C0563|nr:uncharacterized protein LOC132865807 [Neoarius graeffei]